MKKIRPGVGQRQGEGGGIPKFDFRIAETAEPRGRRREYQGWLINKKGDRRLAIALADLKSFRPYCFLVSHSNVTLTSSAVLIGLPGMFGAGG